jgi:hypothetical protein
VLKRNTIRKAGPLKFEHSSQRIGNFSAKSAIPCSNHVPVPLICCIFSLIATCNACIECSSPTCSSLFPMYSAYDLLSSQDTVKWLNSGPGFVKRKNKPGGTDRTMGDLRSRQYKSNNTHQIRMDSSEVVSHVRNIISYRQHNLFIHVAVHRHQGPVLHHDKQAPLTHHHCRDHIISDKCGPDTVGI